LQVRVNDVANLLMTALVDYKFNPASCQSLEQAGLPPRCTLCPPCSICATQYFAQMSDVDKRCTARCALDTVVAANTHFPTMYEHATVAMQPPTEPRPYLVVFCSNNGNSLFLLVRLLLTSKCQVRPVTAWLRYNSSLK